MLNVFLTYVRFKCFEYGTLICNVHKNLFFLAQKCHTFNGMNTKRSYRIYYYFKLIRTMADALPTYLEIFTSFTAFCISFFIFFK